MSTPLRRTWMRVAATPLVIGAALFATSQRLDWLAGWAYIVLVVLIQLSVIVIVERSSPGLLAERERMQQGTKPWDKVIAPLIALVLPAAMWLAAGIDFGRHGAARFTPSTQIIGFLAAAAASALTTWAMAVNRFFAATVRIQTDRGQYVVSNGPYSCVRHPGCVGMIGFTLATPFALGSRYALVPSVICLALLIVRTVLEDATLQSELQGYKEYAGRVRWRLVPGLW